MPTNNVPLAPQPGQQQAVLLSDEMITNIWLHEANKWQW